MPTSMRFDSTNPPLLVVGVAIPVVDAGCSSSGTSTPAGADSATSQSAQSAPATNGSSTSAASRSTCVQQAVTFVRPHEKIPMTHPSEFMPPPSRPNLTDNPVAILTLHTVTKGTSNRPTYPANYGALSRQLVHASR